MMRKGLYILTTILLILNSLTTKGQSKKDSTVTFSSIVITDKPASSYKGVYKDGKPYKGYFKVGDRDFSQVDFYQKGERKHQYSFDFLKNMDGAQTNDIPEFNIKSTYKNDKIIDGFEYITIKDGIVIKKWKKGILNSFSVDVFAKHYFNRILFEKKDDTLWVHNIRDKKTKVKSYFKKGFQVIQTYTNDTLSAHKETVDYSGTLFPKNSQIFSFKRNTTIKSFAHKIIENKNATLRGKNINVEILSFLDISNSKNIHTFFTNTAIALSNKKGISTLFNDKKDLLILAYLSTDSLGKIAHGIRWVATKNHTGYYEIYKNGTPSEKKEIAIQEFQVEAQSYFKNSRKVNE